MIDTEDKDTWCDLGEDEERNFLKAQDFHLVNFMPNPEKDNDKYTQDLRVSFPSDLKTVRTAWRRSQEMFGLDPSYAISLNRKDVERYNRLYPNIIIVFDIDMDGYKAVHWADLTRINRLIKSNFAKEHIYKNRVDDDQGNAKSSFVFDCRWFPIMRKE